MPLTRGRNRPTYKIMQYGISKYAVITVTTHFFQATHKKGQ